MSDFNDIFKELQNTPERNYDEGYAITVISENHPTLNEIVIVKKRKELANLLIYLKENKWAVVEIKIMPYVSYYPEFLERLKSEGGV